MRSEGFGTQEKERHRKKFVMSVKGEASRCAGHEEERALGRKPRRGASAGDN